MRMCTGSMQAFRTCTSRHFRHGVASRRAIFVTRAVVGHRSWACTMCFSRAVRHTGIQYTCVHSACQLFSFTEAAVGGSRLKAATAIVLKVMAAASSSAFCEQSWESNRPRWEQGEPGQSDSDVPDEELTGEAAGEQLCSLLLSLVWGGKLSAKSACTIAWWSVQAGARGAVQGIALKPNSAMGHFSRKTDQYCGIDLKNHSHYLVDAPGHNRFDHSRVRHAMPLRLPHEVMEDELSQSPDLPQQLAEFVAQGKCPPAYAQHKVVSDNTDLVLPLALFVDGVQFNQRSSLVGMFVYNLVTGRRFLRCACRKAELCQCGCRGWCSLYAIFATIHWSLTHCAGKRWPRSRQDGRDWIMPHDAARARKAGTALSIRSCLLFIKGDWAEYSHTFGLAAWNTRLAPCPFCLTTTEHMYRFGDHTLHSSPWGRAGHEEYDAACNACERRVVLSADHHKALRPLLMYDRRKDGALGRCLTRDYEPLQLKAGDRLEPCAELSDVAEFETLHSFPTALTFWRRANETRTRRRCPLFDASIGVTVERLQIDILHTVYLGSAQDWCARSMWAMMLADIFDVGRGRTRAEQIELSVLQFRARLFEWYRQQRIAGVPLTSRPLKIYRSRCWVSLVQRSLNRKQPSASPSCLLCSSCSRSMLRSWG